MPNGNAPRRNVYRSRRPDGRFLSTLGFNHYALKTGRPKLAFTPGMSAEELRAWRAAVKDKLRELMGFPQAPPQPAPCLLWTQERSGYKLQKWESYPEPGSVVPLLMLVPNGASTENPAPAVLCSPGSQHTKEFLAGEPELDPTVYPTKFPEQNKMAWWYAQAGMVAVAVENPGTGELADGIQKTVDSQRNCVSVDLIFTGRSYLGLSVFQKLHILEWMKTLGFVDSQRIALSGHSLGTEPAMVLAVLGDSIRALVFNDFLCNCRQRICVLSKPGDVQRHWVGGLWHLAPGLLDWVDFPDILAAFAPRPLIITEGGPTAELLRVQQAYAAHGAGGNFKFYYYPKYENAERRRDDEEIPEGLTGEEYLEYANVDAPNHYFKHYLAVPWLTRVLSSGATFRV